MIQLICFVRPRPGMDRDAFHGHWLETHGPLIRDTPEDFQAHWRRVHGPLFRDTPEIAQHMLGYVQHHRMASDRARDASLSAEDEGGWEGLTEVWLRDRAGFRDLYREPAYRRSVVPDEDGLLDRSAMRWIVCRDADIIIEGSRPAFSA